MIQRVTILPLLVASLVLDLSGQFRDWFSNPEIPVKIMHAPSLGIQAKRVAFREAQGPCSDQFIDALISDFVENKVEVIDRQNLDSILREHNFSRSGYVDQKTAAELGKILGPTTLLSVKVQRCAAEKNSLYEDKKTYDSNQPTKRVHISRTQFFFKASLQVIDLATGKIFAAKIIEHSPRRENRSETGVPEFPAEYELQDEAIRMATRSVHHMFFPWEETQKLTFFDDKDCDLKQAHQLLVSGDVEGALRRSEENLEKCKSLPKVKKRTLGHAYYNVGLTNYALGLYDKALEYLREAANYNPGDIVGKAVNLVRQAQENEARMREVLERVAVEAAQQSAQEQAKERELRADGPLGIQGIIEMKQAGFSENLIIARIRKDGKGYNLTPNEMKQLQNAGLSECVLLVMMDPNTSCTPPEASAAPPAPQAKPTPAAAPKPPRTPAVKKPGS
jgi:tetratricopeptide (TPR) repeat protein